MLGLNLREGGLALASGRLCGYNGRQEEMVATDVYQKLARYLDDLPGGFPATTTGVELRLLRRLFTPEQAELALHLTLLAEEPRVIARRAKRSQSQ